MSVERINGEPVELVTPSTELRIGDTVYVRCSTEAPPRGLEHIVHGCGRFHRGMLIDFQALMPLFGGRYIVEDAWRMVPKTPCSHGADTFSRGAVLDGGVYRVINPPLASDDAEENRGIERQRIRKVLAR